MRLRVALAFFCCHNVSRCNRFVNHFTEILQHWVIQSRSDAIMVARRPISEFEPRSSDISLFYQSQNYDEF